MILQLQDWLHRHGSAPADVCVIGAGPAGLEIALELERCGKSVLVLEAGGRAIDPRDQHPGALQLTGHPFLGGNHDFRRGMRGPAADAVRIRALGGTSTIWSGKWKLPDRIDLEPRTWIGPHGWPLTWADLAPHADAVMHAHGVPGVALRDHADTGEAAGLLTAFHFEQNPPVNFATRYHAALESSKRLTVVLGAAVVELLPAPGGACVEAVQVSNRDGVRARIPAGCFVLAAGGIETARLLLASKRFGGVGPGNRHGHVGRTFMEHPKARLGVFHPAREAAAAGLLGRRRRIRLGVQTRWTLPPARQQALGIANHAIGLFPAGERAPWPLRWFRDPPAHELFVFMEQLPNPESRVSLSLEHDESGMPRARVHWVFRPEDEAGLRTFVATVESIVAPRYGRMEIDDSALAPGGWAAGSHPMGTARMAARAEDGVVDRDCKVFGVDNLHVAGSAVFPVAGNANPTLLLLALARRLAKHLGR